MLRKWKVEEDKHSEPSAPFPFLFHFPFPFHIPTSFIQIQPKGYKTEKQVDRVGTD